MRKYILSVLIIVLLSYVIAAEECERGWKCQGSWRIYEDDNCIMRVREYCEYGCRLEGCSQVDTCAQRWKCNGNFRELIDDNCDVKNRQYCSDGCENGTCIVIQPLNITKIFRARDNLKDFSKPMEFDYSYYDHALDASLKLRDKLKGDFQGYFIPGEDPQVAAIYVTDDFPGFAVIGTNSSDDTAQIIGCSWNHKEDILVTLSSNNEIRKKICDDIDCPDIDECKIIDVERSFVNKSLPDKKENTTIDKPSVQKEEKSFFFNLWKKIKSFFR